jgi:hypothetical protein
MCIPMLDRYVYINMYIGECILLIIQHLQMVSKNFIRSEDKQNFITSQMLIFGGYLKVGEFVYSWVVVELIAILNRIDRVCIKYQEGEVNSLL